MLSTISHTKVFFALLLCSFMSGCGGSGLTYKTATVSGTVTYQEKPLDSGLIRFIPNTPVVDGQVAGKPAFGKIENGTYSIPSDRGATVGSNRVEIVSYRKTGKKTPMEDTMIEETEQILADKYNVKSTLTADVKSGDNKLDFKLD
jgi:hypothetical protein